MKRLLLSVVNLVLASLMLLLLVAPIAKFNTETLEGELTTKWGQAAAGIYFVETIFIDDAKLDQASKDWLDKELELSSKVLKGEITAEQKQQQLLISPEQNRYDVYNFATQENLILYGLNPNSGNMIKQTKTVSTLVFAYVICAGLTVLISVITVFLNFRKLKGLGTFLTFVAFALSVALSIVIELTLKVQGTLVRISSAVHWALYVFIGYAFIYMIIRSFLNRVTN